MIYLICQEWKNTSNNHAGILYLCNSFDKSNSNYKTLVIKEKRLFESHNRLSKKLNFYYDLILRSIQIKKCLHKLLDALNSEDIVVFMEYMEHPTVLQMANAIRNKKKYVKIVGMAHLVPLKYDKMYSDTEISKWFDSVDILLTLGSSLTKYFIKRGCAQSKVRTTYHYVDTEYYCIKNKGHKAQNRRIKAIAMGNQMRNMTLLKTIVGSSSEIDFIICQGMMNLHGMFSKFDNVEIVPFVEESELKRKMQEADISLNVMDDTIGSNVIVTSMAMGLAMICSDVGSIRDYCDDSNCVFCDNSNPESFVLALQNLNNNRSLVIEMKESAANKAKSFEILRFAEDFRNLISN